jgi:hypothetical protein
MLKRVACLSALLVAACSGPVRYEFDVATVDAATTPDAATADAPTVQDGIVPLDAAPPPQVTLVYAHTDTVLYAVDPTTNMVRVVGTFGFPTDGHMHEMTDLAVDADGRVVGSTRDALYQVNPTTAACTLLAPLPGDRGFVGLTYLPVGVLDDHNEVLVGGAQDGTYWRIDPRTGDATMVGRFRDNWQLSGDIVSIAGAATYATVRHAPTGGAPQPDSLATIDPRTGAVTIIGTNTGFSRIFGLGYWRSTLFGFTRDGEFIIIDATTGRARLVSTTMPVAPFAGAAVSTLAPVAPG